MPGSNFEFKICSDKKEHFDLAMTLAFTGKMYDANVTHYSISKKYGLILFWCSVNGGKIFVGEPTGSDINLESNWTPVIKLPYEMDGVAAASFAWNWLMIAEYDREPDHDGDNDRGFIVYNEDWGHIANRHEGLVAIKPCWQMYGK